MTRLGGGFVDVQLPVSEEPLQSCSVTLGARAQGHGQLRTRLLHSGTVELVQLERPVAQVCSGKRCRNLHSASLRPGHARACHASPLPDPPLRPRHGRAHVRQHRLRDALSTDTLDPPAVRGGSPAHAVVRVIDTTPVTHCTVPAVTHRRALAVATAG